MVAARDLLMLTVALAPLKGARLRQALPNVIEEYLIQDPQACHIALDPKVVGSNQRVLATVDRAWFRFVYEPFLETGHRGLRAVPITRCLSVDGTVAAGATADPAADKKAESLFAIIMGPTESIASAVPSAPCVELALIRDGQGEGLMVPVDALDDTLSALAADAPLALYRLTDVPGSPTALPLAYADKPSLSFETLARQALSCPFNLCQFEFAEQSWRPRRATLKHWRLPFGLAIATLMAAVLGVNLQWLLLTRQHTALSAQQIEVLLSVFPKTTVVLNPPQQMTRQLDALRIAAGELSPTDFLSLAEGLARSLGAIPAEAIAQLDYRNRLLEVGFKPTGKIDQGFAQRLAMQGLEGHFTQGKWMIKGRG
jgi:general secretion pathway protein L